MSSGTASQINSPDLKFSYPKTILPNRDATRQNKISLFYFKFFDRGKIRLEEGREREVHGAFNFYRYPINRMKIILGFKTECQVIYCY